MIEQSFIIFNYIYPIYIYYNCNKPMWSQYQYRQGKLKLIKDLKTGQPHLRVSLIDQQQINDLNKIYQQRRDYYKIDTSTTVIPTIVQESFQQQGIYNLSYKQKIESYRKKLQEQKMQHKYSSLFKKIQKKKTNLRNPVLHKLLQNFETSQKNQTQNNIKQDIKQSQKNLDMIKINSNRRAFFTQKTQNTSITRPRFISLQNSLPQKQTKQFPKWIDYANGKYLKPDNINKGINIISLQNNLQEFITKKYSQPQIVSHNHSLKQSHVHRQRSMTDKIHIKQFQLSNNKYHHNQKQETFILLQQERKRQVKTADVYDKLKDIQKMDKSFMMNKTFKSKTSQSKKFYKSKTNQNINNAIKTFSKSQHYSKEVIDTMSGFYKTKANIKEDYKKMVYFLKNDRPFTSQLRRRNYKLVGQQNLKNVKQYRNISQRQRKKIREDNFKFYLQLLKKMIEYSIQELPLSSKIIQKIRNILQSNYYLDFHHYEQITQIINDQRDPMSNYLIKAIEQLILKHKKINISQK